MESLIEQLKLDGLIASAKLSGRIDVLVELRDWLDEKTKDAERSNKQQRKALAKEMSK